jgi:hypothetical protein
MTDKGNPCQEFEFPAEICFGRQVIDHEWQSKEFQMEFGKRLLSAVILFKRNSTAKLPIVRKQTLPFRLFKKLMLSGAVFSKELLGSIIWIGERIEQGNKTATISLTF